MIEEKNNIFYTNPVEDNKTGIRIDKFIAEEINDISRSMVQKLIDKGCVFSDEEIITDKDFKTRLGDVYQVNITIDDEIVTAITGYNEDNKVVQLPDEIVEEVEEDITEE